MFCSVTGKLIAIWEHRDHGQKQEVNPHVPAAAEWKTSSFYKHLGPVTHFMLMRLVDEIEFETSKPLLWELLEAEVFRNVCQFRGFEEGYEEALTGNGLTHKTHTATKEENYFHLDSLI